ncbi:catecholate siderophore receptor Fiu [Pseudoduganella rivuli]
MSVIRSRKHNPATQPLLTQSMLNHARLNQSLLALAALSLPLAASAQQEKTMSEVKVNAAADVPFKADKVSSPKLTQPLIDTTQTISVIRKEVLQEQAASSLVEALQNTPGITLQLGENGNTSAGDTFQMRGFSAQSSIFVDGIRDLGAVTRDVFNIEQIEVSKGPAGADIGRGAAAGYINLSSKLPQRENAVSGTIGYNSGEKARATADLNRIIGDNAAFRLNAMAEDGGLMGRKVIDKQRHAIAPSLAFGLGTPTRVYIYSQHVRSEGTPDGGIPAIGIQGFNPIFTGADAAATMAIARSAPRVGREAYYGYGSDHEKMDADMATVKIEHELGAKTTLTNVTRYGRSSIDRILTGINAITPTGGANTATWTIARTRQSVLQENKILANITNVVSEFAAAGLQHTVSAGLEFMSEEQTGLGRTGLGTTTGANLYAPNPNDVLAAYNPVLSGQATIGKTTTAAVYAFDTIKLSDQWQVNGGLRSEHYSAETLQAPAVGATVAAPRVTKSDNLNSMKAGILYKPADNGSIYLSYATSYLPPGGNNFTLAADNANSNANAALDPQKTTNLELGTKWDVIEKQLALTAALYRTDNKNEFTLQDATTNDVSQLGKRRVQGIELGAVGQITRNWSIIAGLATMDTRILQGTTLNNAVGAATRWSPDFTATLWTSYKWNDALSFGGGVRHTSEQKRVVDPGANMATQNTPAIPAYTVADAMASFKVSRNVSLQLNVYNLFDKFYVGTLNNGGSRATVGAPRSAQLTANFLF